MEKESATDVWRECSGVCGDGDIFADCRLLPCRGRNVMIPMSFFFLISAGTTPAYNLQHTRRIYFHKLASVAELSE